MLSKENIQHVPHEFPDSRKTAHTNALTRKYVIMIRNKHIYDFERQFLTLHFLSVQLHMVMLTMIICKRRSQLRKNKEIILH